MSEKPKKSKHKSKKNYDVEIKSDKKVSSKESDNINNSSKNENKTKFGEEVTRKRKNTKVSHKSKENKLDSLNNQILDDGQIGRKVKFAKIDIIDVESWKKLNLKMTADENLDELIKLTEGKKGRVKNVSCNCIIL